MELDFYKNNEFETPCFIFKQDVFDRNIKNFKESLSKYFGSKGALAYSFKTNYFDAVIKRVRALSAFAEVVSEKEYELALEIGFEPDCIVYNGPVKSKKSFLSAIENGSYVNIDSKREIKWLAELSKDKSYKVGIRVNFDAEKEIKGQTLMADDGGRFGFCVETGEFADAISEINKYNNISVNCLHMHISNKGASVSVYELLTKKALEFAGFYKIELEILDIGGGFFGGNDDGEAYEAYVKAIHTVLDENAMGDISLIVEPGGAVVATAFDYLTEIVDVKTTGKGIFTVADGSRLHLDPFFLKSSYRHEIISDGEITDAEQTVCGFTCMEKDRIIKLKNDRKLSVGDRILFKVVGAYTLGFNSEFINHVPGVYSINGDKLKKER